MLQRQALELDCLPKMSLWLAQAQWHKAVAQKEEKLLPMHTRRHKSPCLGTWCPKWMTHSLHVRSLRTEDIVAIEDVSSFARDHASHIHEELQRRVWHVRGNPARRQWREEAKRFSIRTLIATSASHATQARSL